MKALRVNADYEFELFFTKSAPLVINESIEFFLFFLNNSPLYSPKKYAPDYLRYVEKLTGHLPKVTAQGPYENFWGAIKDREVEKWWNSKITSTQLITSEGWCQRTRIISNESQIAGIHWDEDYILKDPFGMSGQKFQLLKREMSIQEKEQIILKALSSGDIILEPKLNRKYDFSQYIFPDSKIIAYQNIVDSKFQYKGSIFQDHHSCTLINLPFYSSLDPLKWQNFEVQTQKIIEHYTKLPNEFGFSIDSFIYEENAELHIRVMSEINYRKTMGQMAYELSQRYAKGFPWTALVLTKSTPNISPLWKSMNEKGVMVLSPGDSRFEVMFLKAESGQEGQDILDRLNRLLPNTQFTVLL